MNDEAEQRWRAELKMDLARLEMWFANRLKKVAGVAYVIGFLTGFFIGTMVVYYLLPVERF